MPIFIPLAAVVALPPAAGFSSVLVPQPASASAATDIAAVTFITRRKGISFSEMHQLCGILTQLFVTLLLRMGPVCRVLMHCPHRYFETVTFGSLLHEAPHASTVAASS